jgi:glycosyltransferase involved in cell wall biosynthesis
VGRFADQKDHAMLLAAFHIVHRQMSEVKLILFGDGPNRSRLEHQRSQLELTDVVDMPGFTPEPFAQMAAADVFVLSSIYEGLPTVLAEALACGTTCVSTDCPSGPREILEDGKYGYLVPVADAPALAEGIINALKKPFPKDLLYARAEFFSEERAAQAYFELLGEVLSQNPGDV